MRRTDDLQYNGLVLVQDDEYPCFTEDSVLLANYLNLKRTDRVADLGSGTGLLSILGQAKTGASFTGIEKHAVLCEMAQRSAELNGQDIPFYTMDILDAPERLGRESFSAVVCNPPYFISGDPSPDGIRADARHQGNETVEMFIETAFQLLKNGGLFYLCYPADQLCSIFFLLRKARLEPKQIKFIMNKKKAVPRLVLIKAKKHAGYGLDYSLFDLTVERE